MTTIFCTFCDAEARQVIIDKARTSYISLCATCERAFESGLNRSGSGFHQGEPEQVVVLRLDDVDRDSEQAGRLPFNANGVAYGVASYALEELTYDYEIEEWDFDYNDPIDRVYGPSERAALHNAGMEAEKQDLEWIIG